MEVFMKSKVITNAVVFAVLILLLGSLLIACYSTSPLTFVGDTAHWHIEINATNMTGNNKEQKVIATYKYNGTLTQLNKYKHIELTFNTTAISGGQTIDIPSKNGLTKKQFSVTTSGNGANMSKNTVPTVTIVFGENKETTKLVKK
jgi:hypothetical protein